MTSPDHNEHVAAFRALHVPGDPVVLPNVWDAASAGAAERAGFPALATTSGGVAKALGFRDGEQTPVDEMAAAVARIAGAVSVPVTADMESGYGLSAFDLVATLTRAGAVGINFEDSDHSTGSIRDLLAQADRVAALRRACDEVGADLVINARVDVFLHGDGSEADRLPDAIARAQAYRDAGADCVFPIFLGGEAEIDELVSAVDAPVNVFFRSGCPSLPRLAELGVARVSFGSGLMKAAYQRLEAVLADLGRRDTSSLTKP